MATQRLQVVTLGESMVLFDAQSQGGLAYGASFLARVAGAESNTAIGLVRLGVGATWISVVGADPFGELILDTLSREGVDVSAVRRDVSHPTGVFFKERPSRERTEVHYYRHGSAATTLRPDDVPADVIRHADVLHISGITMGLGASARAAVHRAVQYAKEWGTPVSVDPNLRKGLPDGRRLIPNVRELLEEADIILGGLDELEAVLRVESPERLFASLPGRTVVVRLGADGAIVATEDGDLIRVPSPRVERVVDLVGAGDAFNAGYLAARLRGFGAADAGKVGTATAIHALRTTGDWEALPQWSEVMALTEELPR